MLVFPLAISAQTDDPRDFEKISYPTDCTDQGGKCMPPGIGCHEELDSSQCAIGYLCCKLKDSSGSGTGSGNGSVGTGTSGNTTQNPNTKPNGPGESRLWFSGLKEVAAMSKILQFIFVPNIGEVADSTDVKFVTTKIEKHQGKDDNTKVVNTKDNNSSLIQNKPAPTPLYDYDKSPDEDLYASDAMCEIKEAKANRGDNLAGPKIKATFTYTQKFQYKAISKKNCTMDGHRVDKPDKNLCCSKSVSEEVDYINGKIEKFWVCDNAPKVPDVSKGRVAVFSKTPLVDYIADALVFGPMAIYKAIMPEIFTKDIKEIPAVVEYSAKGGDSPLRSLLYIPRVGSIKEYFIDTIQRILRPLKSGKPVTDKSNDYYGVCMDYIAKYPTDLVSSQVVPSQESLDWMVRFIEEQLQNGNTTWTGTKFKENYQKIIDFGTKNSVNPAFLLSLYLEETHGEATGTYPLGCGNYTTLDGSLDCVAGFRPDLKNNLLEYLSIYAGGHSPYYFDQHPNFLCNLFPFYNLLTGNNVVLSPRSTLPSSTNISPVISDQTSAGSSCTKLPDESIIVLENGFCGLCQNGKVSQEVSCGNAIDLCKGRPDGSQEIKVPNSTTVATLCCKNNQTSDKPERDCTAEDLCTKRADGKFPVGTQEICCQNKVTVNEDLCN